MEPPIVAALIAATATILAGILVNYRDVIVDRFRFKPRSISGFWRGLATYVGQETRIHYFTCRLRQLGSRFSGTLSSEGEDAADYKVTGSFLETEYFQVNVGNTNPNSVNYSTGILRFSRSGNELSGYFVARARGTEGIVTGRLELRRP